MLISFHGELFVLRVFEELFELGVFKNTTLRKKSAHAYNVEVICFLIITSTCNFVCVKSLRPPIMLK